MKELISAIKHYQKEKDAFYKASKKNTENFFHSSTKRRAALSRKVHLCAEAKEKAFWYVVSVILNSEFSSVFNKTSIDAVRNATNALGRYPSYFQTLNGEQYK